MKALITMLLLATPAYGQLAVEATARIESYTIHADAQQCDTVPWLPSIGSDVRLQAYLPYDVHEGNGIREGGGYFALENGLTYFGWGMFNPAIPGFSIDTPDSVIWLSPTPGGLNLFVTAEPYQELTCTYVTSMQSLVTEYLPGDANRDYSFDSTDLIQVFQAGEYEDGIPHNSRWAAGDWNADLEFTTADLIAAMQTGAYDQPAGAFAAVPEPSAVFLWALGCLLYPVRRIEG